MDLLDRAQQLEELERDFRIAEALKAGPVLSPRGYCLFCEASLPYPLRFCDADCCKDWENEQEARKRNGKSKEVYDDPMDDFSCSK